MIIEIRSHGGFGGITAAQTRRIDTDSQTGAVRDALCAAFGPDSLSRLASTPCPDCADRMRYAITVTEAAGTPHSVTLSEAQLPPEMLDLMDRV